MSDIPPPAAIAAFITAWQDANSATPLPATPSTAPSTAPPSSQLTYTPFSALNGTVSSTRLAYLQRLKEKRAPVVERDIPIAVTFYLQERPGETQPIPDGIVIFL